MKTTSHKRWLIDLGSGGQCPQLLSGGNQETGTHADPKDLWNIMAYQVPYIRNILGNATTIYPLVSYARKSLVIGDRVCSRQTGIYTHPHPAQPIHRDKLWPQTRRQIKTANTARWLGHATPTATSTPATKYASQHTRNNVRLATDRSCANVWPRHSSSRSRTTTRLRHPQAAASFPWSRALTLASGSGLTEFIQRHKAAAARRVRT